jgi:hypothetical protein
MVRSSLTAQGYLPPNPNGNLVATRDFKLAITKFQADQGMVVTGVLDFTTFESALRGFVAVDSAGALQRVGWTVNASVPATGVASNNTNPITNPITNPSDTPNEPPAPLLALDMQIENLGPDKSSFESGQQIFASAVLNRAAYLQCYLIEAQGNIVRVLPNATNPNALMSAQQAIRIPDWMAPNPGFVMDAGSPGTESLLCIASEQDPSGKLPEALLGPSFIPIAGYKGALSITDAYAAAAGAESFAARALQWKVLPKRAAPAPVAPAATAK